MLDIFHTMTDCSVYGCLASSELETDMRLAERTAIEASRLCSENRTIIDARLIILRPPHFQAPRTLAELTIGVTSVYNQPSGP